MSIPGGTRELVERFVSARERNDTAQVAAMLAEDAEWYPPLTIRSRPYRGRDRIAAALTGGATGRVLVPGSIRRTTIQTVVEIETAVVRQLMTATRLDGGVYRNEYCWVYTCEDGLISRLVEYGDTLVTARAGFIPLTEPTAAAHLATPAEVRA